MWKKYFRLPSFHHLVFCCPGCSNGSLSPPFSRSSSSPTCQSRLGGGVSTRPAETALPARPSSLGVRLPAGGRESEHFRSRLVCVLASSAALPLAFLPLTPSFFSVLPTRQNNFQAGGGNGSHKKRRADPRGKGAAASHLERYGCWVQGAAF